jgi:dephospho-CoA kinase
LHYLGLTGGPGCGKTTVAGLLRERGWGVIECDAIAHELLQPGRENWQKVVDEFGPRVLTDNREIDRKALGKIVFSSPELLQKLNSITHPAIREYWLREKEEFEKRFPEKNLVVEVPLLFELGLQKEFDQVVCVACSKETQEDRLLARGWQPWEVRARRRSQLPLEEKMCLSDRVLWNEGTVRCLERQLDFLL